MFYLLLNISVILWYLILDLLFCSVLFIVLSPCLSISAVYLLFLSLYFSAWNSSVHSVVLLCHFQFNITVFHLFEIDHQLSVYSTSVTLCCCFTMGIYCCVCHSVILPTFLCVSSFTSLKSEKKNKNPRGTARKLKQTAEMSQKSLLHLRDEIKTLHASTSPESPKNNESKEQDCRGCNCSVSGLSPDGTGGGVLLNISVLRQMKVT